MKRIKEHLEIELLAETVANVFTAFLVIIFLILSK
jgi:hypothetical protein